jgi:hypothetical protein
MMDVSPTAHFVTLCAREPAALQPGEIQAAAAAIQNWDVLATTGAEHGVTGFVRQAVAREGIALPWRTERALRDTALVELASVLRLNLELARGVDALVSTGLPVIVLKGPALARTIYPIATLRPYTDIDLTVQERHEAAAAALMAKSYTEVPNGAEEARRTRAGHLHEGAAFHRVFVTSQEEAAIELHTDPLQLGLRPTCEADRWARALPVPDLPGALMLCPEDQLVHLSVHAHKHGFSRLIWLKDLDLLLRTRGQCFDWDLAVETARREGVQASVWYGLRLVSTLLRTPVPRAQLERLRPGPLLRSLYHLVWPVARIADLDGYMRRRGVQFHAAESWRGMLPSLVLMGRRRTRARAILEYLLPA